MLLEHVTTSDLVEMEEHLDGRETMQKVALVYRQLQVIGSATRLVDSVNWALKQLLLD